MGDMRSAFVGQYRFGVPPEAEVKKRSPFDCSSSTCQNTSRSPGARLWATATTVPTAAMSAAIPSATFPLTVPSDDDRRRGRGYVVAEERVVLWVVVVRVVDDERRQVADAVLVPNGQGHRRDLA